MMNRRLSITKTTAATRRMAHTRPFKSLCRALKKNSVKTRSDSGEKQKKKRRNQSAVRCWKKNETPVALFLPRTVDRLPFEDPRPRTLFTGLLLPSFQRLEQISNSEYHSINLFVFSFSRTGFYRVLSLGSLDLFSPDFEPLFFPNPFWQSLPKFALF